MNKDNRMSTSELNDTRIDNLKHNTAIVAPALQLLTNTFDTEYHCTVFSIIGFGIGKGSGTTAKAAYDKAYGDFRKRGRGNPTVEYTKASGYSPDPTKKLRWVR